MLPVNACKVGAGRRSGLGVGGKCQARYQPVPDLMVELLFPPQEGLMELPVPIPARGDGGMVTLVTLAALAA